MLTGESLPVDKCVGDKVAGATINTSGVLTVRAAAVGAETALSQIIRLVQEAQAGQGPGATPRRSHLGRLRARGPCDRPDHLHRLDRPRRRPHPWARRCRRGVDHRLPALGLATPTAIMVGTGRGAGLGILIKSIDILERSRQVTTVVFDKTGTLARGEMTVTDIAPSNGTSRDEVLIRTGAVEADSEHPVGRAIADAARDESAGQVPATTDFDAAAGHGVRAIVDDTTLWVGRRKLMAEAGLTMPPELASAAERLEHQGRTAVFVGWGEEVRGVVGVADTLKSNARNVVQRLPGLPEMMGTREPVIGPVSRGNGRGGVVGSCYYACR